MWRVFFNPHLYAVFFLLVVGLLCRRLADPQLQAASIANPLLLLFIYTFFFLPTKPVEKIRGTNETKRIVFRFHNPLPVSSFSLSLLVFLVGPAGSAGAEEAAAAGPVTASKTSCFLGGARPSFQVLLRGSSEPLGRQQPGFFNAFPRSTLRIRSLFSPSSVCPLAASVLQ